jgi:hypothetical protein
MPRRRLGKSSSNVLDEATIRRRFRLLLLSSVYS